MHGWLSWMHRVIAVGAPGVGVVALLHGPTLVVSLAMLTLFVVTFAHLARSDDGEPAHRTRAICTSIVRISSCVVTVVCCAGLAAAFHPAAALLLVAGLTASSPPVRRRAAARFAVLAPSGPTRAGAAVPPELVGIKHFTDAELQHAWCHTSHVLGCATDPGRRLGLVVTRQHLLDEVWKRDRPALEQWVADGARAHDGTSRYFDSP